MSNQVPEGWQFSKVSKLFSFQKGNISPSAFADEIFNYYSLPAFDEFGDSITVRGSEIDSNKTLLNQPTILVSKLNPRKPRVMIADNRSNLRSCASTEFMAYVAKSAKQHLPFYKQYFESESFHRKLEVVATGSTNSHVRVSPKETMQWEIAFPPLPEQQKIAKILTSVDEVIEKTQAQIDKLKDLKTGMMQELLTQGVGVDGKPHTEFKDSPVGRIPKAWKVVKLSQVLVKIDSGWSPACIETPPATGQWGVIKVSAVTRGCFLETESKTLPENLAPKPHIQVQQGDLLLTRANGVADLVGKCVMVNDRPKANLMMSDKILRLNPRESVCPFYLLHYFNSKVIRKQIELSWGGSSGQKNISQTDIKSYLIALPSLDEQKAIGSSITHVDKLLVLKEAKLIKLNAHKKALMQDLLTGKVRVNID